ncbi:MAG: glycosyltransferase family 4 protein [Pseudomonadota bacterium]
MVSPDLHREAAEQSDRQRVLFITRKWGPAVGGMETYCERLTAELARLQPVEIIALKGESNGQPPKASRLLAFPFTVLKRLVTTPDRPDIVHLGDMAIWPLGLLAKLIYPSSRVVLSAHGTDVAYGARGGLRGRLYDTYLRTGARLLKRARVIANSRATRDRVGALDWRTQAVVPLATDLKGALPKRKGAFDIVFAGRLVERKGCGWFIREVLPLLSNEARLIVIGTVWDADEEAALDRSQVEFLGPMPQARLAWHFAAATCVVVPNIEPANGEYEGFGLVAPEAASAGGVVIASDSGGLADAVIDRETGFLLEPGDARAWADKIVEVAAWSEAERAEFIGRSQSMAQRHYSWSRVARDTVAAYREDLSA